MFLIDKWIVKAVDVARLSHFVPILRCRLSLQGAEPLKCPSFDQQTGAASAWMTQYLVRAESMDLMLRPVVIEVLRKEMPACYDAQLFNVQVSARQCPRPPRRDNAIVIQFTQKVRG